MRCLNLRVGESHRVFSEEPAEMACPFYCSGTTRCAASLSAMVVKEQKKILLCWSDNHDNCPLFLAKTLRMRTLDGPSD